MTTQELYSKVKKGEITKEQFLFEVKRDPRFVSIIHVSNNFDDTVSILKNKGMITESEESSQIKHFNVIGMMREGLEKMKQPLNEAAKPAPYKQKLKGGKGDKLTPDDVNYYEFQKGWRHELEHTDDVDKAKEIALDHLAEDPIYYTRLQMVEYQAKKQKRTDLPIEVTKKEVKDPNNQMEKVKKITNSNTGKVETHKVEEPKKNVGNKKEKPKSIKTKVMKGGPGNMVTKSLKEFLEMLSDKKKLNEELDNEIKIKGKVVKSYSQNGDKSYNVEFQDGTTSKVYASSDDWDILNNHNIENKKKINLMEADDSPSEEQAPLYKIQLNDKVHVFWPLTPENLKIIKTNPTIVSVKLAKPTAQKTNVKTTLAGMLKHKPGEERDKFRREISTDLTKIPNRVFLSLLKKATDLSKVRYRDESQKITIVKGAGTGLTKAEKLKKGIGKAEPPINPSTDQDIERLIVQKYGQYQIVDNTKNKIVTAAKTKEEAEQAVEGKSNYSVQDSIGLYNALLQMEHNPSEYMVKVKKNQEEDTQLNEFKDIVRKIFYKKLNEFNVMMLPQGPRVKKKELNRILQGYQWDAPEDNYQKLNKQEALKKIMDLIRSLGKPGEKLYHDYEPKGGDQGTDIEPGMSENGKKINKNKQDK